MANLIGNLKRREDQATNIGQIVGVFASEVPFGFSATDALDSTKWEDRMLSAKGSRMVVINSADSTMAPAEDAVFYEGNTQLFQYKMRDGKLKIELEYACFSSAQFAALRALDGKTLYLAMVTRNGFILGGTNATYDFALLRSTAWVSGMKAPENPETPFLAKVSFQLENSSDYYAKILNPKVDAIVSWNPSDYDGIDLCNLTISAIADTSLVVTVTSSNDGAAIEGLVAGDFVMTNLGVPHTITSVTAVNNVYTVNFGSTGAGAATLDLRPTTTTGKFVETLAVTAFIAV